MIHHCPLCKKPAEVRINRKNKPYLRCDLCGVLMFVNKPEGARMLNQASRPVQCRVVKKTGSAADFLFGS